MEEPELTPEQKNEAIRDRYIPMMAPVFFPDEPTKPDIIQLFASLLRVLGVEDKGWDPYTRPAEPEQSRKRILRPLFAWSARSSYPSCPPYWD